MQRALGRSTVKFVTLPAELGRSANYNFEPKPPIRHVPYVPTPENVVATMLEMAEVSERDVVYDLGCGDGRIVIAAAKERGARGVGIDIDPEWIKSCVANSIAAKVEDRVRFSQASVFDIDASEASVVMLYLLPWMTAQLRPKLLKELKPGTRIVAHQYPIADWPADEIVHLPDSDRVVYRWVVPAKVGGAWQATVRTDDGRLRRGMITWEQEFQTIVASAELDGEEVQVERAALCGREVRFNIGRVTYYCTVDGEQMRGSAKSVGGRSQLEFRARRTLAR